MQLNPEMLELFRYWILERENIRCHKEMGAIKPWSPDPIFQKHHFCNVRREDDRGTKELRAAWEDTFWDTPKGMMEWPAQWTAARMLNYAPSFLRVLIHWNNPARWQTELKLLQEEGKKVFHTAYVVSTCGKSMNKVDYVLNVVFAVRKLTISRTSCQRAYEQLLSVDGLGSFMAGQIVADLKNIGYIPNTFADDWWSFSVPGPGSLKGLSYLFGEKITAAKYDIAMDMLRLQLPNHMLPQCLHAQDLQNCLCEFSKYVRYLRDEPGRRRYYEG